MIKAFVFGKFLPFHQGHQAMISFALSQCDFLSVLVCCDQEEQIPGRVRKNWIETTFADTAKLEVKVLQYDHHLLPNTSVASLSISERWSDVFKKLYPDYDLLITSEPYGEFVANFMHIRHLAFDPAKVQFPTSATAIRNHLFANWHFLPEAVKPYFAIKVVILGTESTGKTTLTQQLAAHYNCSCVLEAGRELITDSNNFTMDDLNLVATEHTKRIAQAMLGDSPLIIIDTDIHITKSYGRFMFDQELPVSHSVYDTQRASLYLYLNNDVPYHQDGTRLNHTDRDLLDRSHREVLAAHRVQFTEISGNWPNRFEQAVLHISKIINSKSNLLK